MDSIVHQEEVKKEREGQSVEQELKKYKENIKIFISEVRKQINELIDGFQHQIESLTKQNRKLQEQLGTKFDNPEENLFGAQGEIECLSPIKKSSTFHSGFYTTGRSNILTNAQFPRMEPLYSTEAKKLTYSEESQLNPLNKSKFEIEGQKKRKRQCELLHFLEPGRANLDLNTSKFLHLIGREPENEEEEEQFILEEAPSKKNSSLNTSLNQICNSLDNSFVAKRAREKSQKKKKVQEKAEDEEAKKRQESEKIKKDKALKNLLQSLRNNINSSKPPETIKGTRLMSTGSSQQKGNFGSKVMINPVPVDITRRDEMRRGGDSSPTKKSILKQSQVLTKSIANISSISYQSSSGGY